MWCQLRIWDYFPVYQTLSPLPAQSPARSPGRATVTGLRFA